jgi:hypothetical protein
MAARAGITSPLSLGGRAATGERGRRNRAPGMGHAVPAHLAGDEPGWHATAAGTHDQQAGGAAGHVGQDPASLAARHDRPDVGTAGDLSPEGPGRNAGSNKRRFGNRKRCPGQPTPPARRLQACLPRRARRHQRKRD